MSRDYFNKLYIYGFGGLLGGLYWLVLNIFFSPDWGPPGTARYLDYESFNRLWPPGLFLLMLGLVGFYKSNSTKSRWATYGFRAVIIGFIMMIVGSLAEFWLFSRASYQDASRTVSYLIFFSDSC